MPVSPNQLQEQTSTVVEHQAHDAPPAVIRAVLTDEVIGVLTPKRLADFFSFIWFTNISLRRFEPVRMVIEQPEWVPDIHARYPQMEAAGGWRQCDSCGIDHLRVTFGAEGAGGADVCALCLVVLQERDARTHQEDLDPYQSLVAAPARPPLPMPNAEFCADAHEHAPVCETCGVRGIRSFFRAAERWQCPFCYTCGTHGGIVDETRLVAEMRRALGFMIRRQPLSAQLMYDVMNGHEPTPEQLLGVNAECRTGEVRLQDRVHAMPEAERMMYDENAMRQDLAEPTQPIELPPME